MISKITLRILETLGQMKYIKISKWLWNGIGWIWCNFESWWIFEDLLRMMFKQILMSLSNGSIHDWGTKNECLTEKKIPKEIFGFLFILH
jgi:hypothetical protein